MMASMAQDVSVAFRWSPEDKAAIKRLADKRGMSVSEYVKRAALGVLDDAPADWRVELERRVREIERVCGLG